GKYSDAAYFSFLRQRLLPRRVPNRAGVFFSCGRQQEFDRYGGVGRYALICGRHQRWGPTIARRAVTPTRLGPDARIERERNLTGEIVQCLWSAAKKNAVAPSG